MVRPLTFYEFFAGGGLARLGLEAAGPWRCLFANDVDARKAAVYRAHFRDNDDPLHVGDVAALTPADLPASDAHAGAAGPRGAVDLAWASFPCQDLSLAGARGGLGAARSGTYWAFHRLMAGLAVEGRAPRMIAIENVTGLLTSHGGADFAAVRESLAALGYAVAWNVIDAIGFTPQSRPRLFILAAHGVEDFSFERPNGSRRTSLQSIIEPDPANWDGAETTAHILSLMSTPHRARVERFRAEGGRVVGTLYRRTRSEFGEKVQRAETRFDGAAGCLRTPAGGSSRQRIIDIDRGAVRTRFMTSREAARLMGVSDDYALPESTTRALHILGDGVAVPVVRWLAETVLAPALAAAPVAEAA